MRDRLGKTVFPLLLVGYVLFAMFRTVGGVVLPAISGEFALSDVEAGLLISAAMLSTAVAMGLVGYISSIAGRGRSLVLGYLLLTLGMGLTGFAPNYFICLLLFATASFGAGVFISTLYALVGEIFPRSRGLLLGVTNSFFAVGGFLGPWLAGNILELYSWREVFQLLGVAAAPVLVTLLLVLRSRYPQTSHRDLGVKASYMKALRNRSITLICLMMATANLAFITFLSWTPTFLLRIQGLQVSQAGLLVGFVSVFGAAGAIVFGLLSDRTKKWLMNAVTGISSGACSLILFNGVYTFDVLVVLAAVFGFTCFAYWNLIIASAQDSVGREEIVLVTGLVTNSGTIGAIFGPLIAGLLTPAVGLGKALVACVTIPLLLYGFSSSTKSWLPEHPRPKTQAKKSSSPTT